MLKVHSVCLFYTIMTDIENIFEVLVKSPEKKKRKVDREHYESKS